MALPYSDPSLPSSPAPIFGDVDAARGDHLRANNSVIWANLNYLLQIAAESANLLNQYEEISSGDCLQQIKNAMVGITGGRVFLVRGTCINAPSNTSDYRVIAIGDGGFTNLIAFDINTSAIFKANEQGGGWVTYNGAYWRKIVDTNGNASQSNVVFGSSYNSGDLFTIAQGYFAACGPGKTLFVVNGTSGSVTNCPSAELLNVTADCSDATTNSMNIVFTVDSVVTKAQWKSVMLGSVPGSWVQTMNADGTSVGSGKIPTSPPSSPVDGNIWIVE